MRTKKKRTARRRKQTGSTGTSQEVVLCPAAGIWDVPLELLNEIFFQLEPLDLLHLSRTTKYLRSILMSKTSIKLWGKARSRIFTLPDCPSDIISEPHYAALIFTEQCFFCRRSQKDTIHWDLRVRCCKRCVPSIMMNEAEVKALGKGSQSDYVHICRSMPWAVVNGTWWCLRSEYSEVYERMMEHGFYSPEFSKFVEERANHVHELRRHAKKWKIWYGDRVAYAVYHTLCLDPEMKDNFKGSLLSQFVKTKEFHAQKFISEDSWATLRGHIDDRVSLLRQGKFAQTFWEVVNQRRHAFLEFLQHYGSNIYQPEGTWPTAADACFNVPEVRDLLESDKDHDVHWVEFRDLLTNHPNLWKDWRESIGRRCIETSNKDPELVDLSAATTVFFCRQPGCQNPIMGLMDLCRHPCMYGGRGVGDKYPEHWEGLDRQFRIDFVEEHGPPWGEFAKKIPILCDYASAVAKLIVEACFRQNNAFPGSCYHYTMKDQVPDHLLTQYTMKDMDERLPYLECETCDDGEELVWKKAIAHGRKHLRRGEKLTFTLVGCGGDADWNIGLRMTLSL